jgi:NADH dehydrogenase
MPKRILILGAGFAGVDAALSAARQRDLANVSPQELEIAVLSPVPVLTIRPRLYEAHPETMVAPLLDLFAAVEVRYIQGTAGSVDPASRTVRYLGTGATEEEIGYDRLVLATGSSLFRPDVPGIAEHAFSVDQLEDAVELDAHIHNLASRSETPARNTVVVAGGGFTGIEAATEMPIRLRPILGEDAKLRVIIVEPASSVAPDMDDNPRPFIEAALRDSGIETHLGVAVASIDAGGVTLSDGVRIEASTVVWSAGMRPSPLTKQIPAERDRLGRLLVNPDLSVPGVAGVYATGDVAKAASDDVGNFALMSCQHAKRMGSFAGNNAAADLLGVVPEPYHQKAYVACLDLGSAGAVLTSGWDRQIQLTGQEAKDVKREINTVWIYPPKADRAEALAYAVPSTVVNL